VQAAERLAREDVQLDGDQRAGRRVQQPVRGGDARDAVGQVAAGAVDRGDLEVLRVRVLELAVTCLHLVADGLQGQQRLLGQPVHAVHERGQVSRDDEVRAMALEGLDRRGGAGAEP
jgi:hypothetical protein